MIASNFFLTNLEFILTLQSLHWRTRQNSRWNHELILPRFMSWWKWQQNLNISPSGEWMAYPSKYLTDDVFSSSTIAVGRAGCKPHEIHVKDAQISGTLCYCCRRQSQSLVWLNRELRYIAGNNFVGTWTIHGGSGRHPHFFSSSPSQSREYELRDEGLSQFSLIQRWTTGAGYFSLTSIAYLILAGLLASMTTSTIMPIVGPPMWFSRQLNLLWSLSKTTTA